MIADVSQQAEHKREKYQQWQTRTILMWWGESSAGVRATVDIPSETPAESVKFPSALCG